LSSSSFFILSSSSFSLFLPLFSNLISLI
jgi:hypothetical protein